MPFQKLWLSGAAMTRARWVITSDPIYETDTYLADD
jgi:hypothetical protein